MAEAAVIPMAQGAMGELQLANKHQPETQRRIPKVSKLIGPPSAVRALKAAETAIGRLCLSLVYRCTPRSADGAGR